MHLIFFYLCILPFAFLQQVHYDNVQYTEVEYQDVCAWYTYEYCTSDWWGFRESCEYEDKQECRKDPINVIKTKIVCHPGWYGPHIDCNIPVCKNACPLGKSCTYPDTCGCLTSGSSCPYVACSTELNCYPGTCLYDSCKCSPSFNGTNCQNSLKIPDIKDCTVKITDNKNKVQTYDCSSVGSASLILWLSTTTIKEIAVSYRVEYEPNTSDFPPNVNYVKESRFGVVGSRIWLRWNGQSIGESKPCVGPSPDAPANFKQCDIVLKYEDSGGNQNQLFNKIVNFTIEAELGGYKIGAENEAIANSDFTKQYYTASFKASRFVTLKFDSKPPTHCLSDKEAVCPFFPIQISDDISAKPRIKATITNWVDSDSGIANYTVAINYLQLDQKGFYVDPKEPVKVVAVNAEHNEFFFDVTAVGVYSAVLTVQDFAGNTAKARNIFTYTGNAQQRIDLDAPVRCTSCAATADYKAINTPTTFIHFNWTGHFLNKDETYTNNNLAKPVSPWNIPGDIDDKAYSNAKNYTYGSRTIHELDKNFQTAVKYGYNVNSNKTSPAKWLITKQNTASLEVSLKTGDILTFFVSCLYLDGTTEDEVQNIIYDDTPLIWGSQTEFRANQPDEFNSKFYFALSDPESGLKSLMYTLKDTTKNIILVQNATAPIRTRESPTNIKKFKRAAIEQPCNDSTCYCTTIGYCYPKQQYIDIDHCVIDRYLEDNLEMQVQAVNYAGKESYKTINLGNSKDLKCRPTGLSSGSIAGIVIGVLLGLILLILLIIFLVWVFVLRKPLAPYDNLKKRFTRQDMAASMDNDLYTAGPDISPTGVGVDRRQIAPLQSSAVAFSNRALNNDDEGEIKETDLMQKEELSSSNFVVSKAIWLIDNKKITVATKGNKQGVNSKMKADLNNKIDIFRKLPNHVNLIKFFGAVNDFKGRGPLIVMEFCPLTLKEWLERADVSPDVLDDMSLFCFNIAKGVEFLHDNKIIHKRLALRNVLLAKYYNQYIAKIIGYGQKPDSDSTLAVPIRWLAPETLSTLKKDRPTYNEKTDSWAFGITVWEIYTFGSKKPYPELSNDEAQHAIKQGIRLEIPENMPNQIFNSVVVKCCQKDPSNRPSFQRISNDLEDFRCGGGEGSDAAKKPGYYSAGEDFYNVSGGYKDVYNDYA